MKAWKVSKSGLLFIGLWFYELILHLYNLYESLSQWEKPWRIYE